MSKTIGIITIHKINNYGSVLQAYALQRVCEELGFTTEIIDYDFPNEFHQRSNLSFSEPQKQSSEPKWIKALFAFALYRQHKNIRNFVDNHLNLSNTIYTSPDSLLQNPPHYDVYITGSDQLWNPRYCKGDPAFMLHFAPDNALKISYAASFGTNKIPSELSELYKTLLSRYNTLSVREKSGVKLIKELTGLTGANVLDPTLLLNYNQWDEIANPKRLVKGKYILCYFLNYSFDAFPYVEQLAQHMKKLTGYKLVSVGRPPHQISNVDYHVGASPEDFLALVRDCSMVLTTSFHGTAFAVNYGKPLITVVSDKNAADSRQVTLMHSLGLDKQILEHNSPFPDAETADYEITNEQSQLATLRASSISYLKNALHEEIN